MLITDRLKETGKMTETERSIAQFFLENPQQVLELSGRKIAQELYLSASTIVRFCQKLGYSGFEAFREDYASEIDYLNSNFQQIDPNLPFKLEDSDYQISNKIGHLYSETIKDTQNLIDFKVLEQARYFLTQHETIYIHSVGDLLVAAYNFKNKMTRLGKQVEVIDRADSAYVTASHATEKACFILISYSGETNQLMRVARRINDLELPLIALTSFGSNALSELADVTLYLSTHERLVNNLGNFSSVLSAAYLLDVLYACIFGDDFQENYDKKVSTATDYERYRKSDNPLLND